MSLNNSKTGNNGRKPTLFILSLPHTQLTSEYVSCAYTQKARKLADMMVDMGYEVFVLGSEDNESKGELITCITKQEQHEFFGDPGEYKKSFYNITWGPEDAHWQHFNNNAIKEIGKRIKPKDLILTFAGLCQKQVADAFPNNFTVEAGIGYTGVFSKFRVYESYAWQSFIHGRADNDNIEWYETVIPNYWDPSEFPFSASRGDKDGEYFLFVGRLIERKGYEIAQQVCERLGKRLILAGQMDKGATFKGYGEYIGTVDTKKRGELMSKATAVFTPTWYLGPFEGVHVEAQLAGAPVITTDFGVYTETVINGFNGRRCTTFKEFIKAAEWAESLKPSERRAIQQNAQSEWSMDSVAHLYDMYFTKLMDLYEDGWYQL